MRSASVVTTALCALAVLFGLRAEASAQARFPSRPIRVILAGSPGSSIDTVARIVAPVMSQVLGRPLVLENIDGAGGTVGATRVAQAPKDGYTIGVVSANFTLAPSLYKALPYHSVKDIAPVTLLTSGSLVLAVNPNRLQATNIAELVQAARAAKEPIAFGSAGVGSAFHLAFELFANMTGTKWLHVPYRGTSQYMTDLLAGEVAAGVITAAGGKPYFDSGQLRPIGVTTKVRSKLLPDVPTICELGLEDYELNSWVGLIAPSGMPADIMAKINDAALKALADPATREKLAGLGSDLLPMSPDEAATIVKSDIERFGALIRSLDIASQ